MISYRARKILLLAVGDYIATGEPVASRALADRHGVDLSPASIRAVLAELEAAGYLRKPHTSAGRVPTEEGLRLFAEAMITLSDRATARDEELVRRLSEVALGLDVVLRHASKVLADMTGSAALLRPPKAEVWVLRDLRFLVLRPRELLAVIVSSSGGVEHRVLRVETTPSPAELDRVNNLLRARIEGRTLSEVRTALAQDLATERARAAIGPRPVSLAMRALEIGEAALAAVSSGTEGVLVEGAAQLIERPEFASVDKARALVRTLDDQELLLALLDRAAESPGLRVVIGGDGTGAGFSTELSLVMAPFDKGVVAVLGSSRMDYSQVVPLVRQTAAQLSEMLRDA